MTKITIISILFFFYAMQQIGFAQKITPEQLKKHVYFLASDSMDGRGLGTDGMQKVRNYIVDEFQNAGIKPLDGKYLHPFYFKLSTVQVNAFNIAGIIEGSDPVLKNEYIVIGAHYDHLGWKLKNNKKVVYNGADDNASGTAAIIEIGRKLATQKQKLKRSVLIIAFDAEESGLYGSTSFIENDIINADQIKFMMSLDMVGMYQKNNGVELTGGNLVKNFEPIYASLSDSLGVKLKKVNSEMEQRTDTKPFGDKGIPAIHVFTNTQSPYHKPEDDSNLLDYDGMAKISDFVSELTIRVANKTNLQLDSKLIAIKAGKPVFDLNLGIRLNAGRSFHDYAKEYFDGKSILSLQSGMFIQWNFGKRLSLQTEFLYETNGSKSDLGTVRIYSISIPVNVMYNIVTRDKGAVFAIFAGAYYSTNFTGKMGSKSLNFKDDFTKDDYGLNYGFCVEINEIQVGLWLKKGLKNIHINNQNNEIYNQAKFLTIGYLF